MGIFRAARLLLTALVLAIAVAPAVAKADEYPTKPIRLIIPGPPGGSTDLLGRLVAAKLADRLGQPIVVDNRPGANGVVGALALESFPADGYTLELTVYPAELINPLIMAKPPYDPIRDFAPISTLSVSPLVLVVGNSVPVKSLKDFLAYAKAQPGKVNYGSSGVGSADQLAVELMSYNNGIKLNHVPYKGSAPLLVDLIGGRIQMRMGSVLTNLGAIRANQVKPLAIDSQTRDPLIPDVPTFTEAGIAPLDVKVMFGIVGRAGTPQPVIDKLSAAINQTLTMPGVQKFVSDNGGQTLISTPAEFAKIIEHDQEKYGKVVKAANIKIN
ncbi:Bug family tripartite tricarboxylate transporter substrate binding protein [Paraburkholderia sp.]|uniref:Bug family tripartite tricarboxylate transporter substrate binding protein n=1 Tax=Paraburkholderia sp. TaxID=1926495 RepID=UPI0039E3C0B9